VVHSLTQPGYPSPEQKGKCIVQILEVTLVDDLDGSAGDQTVSFSLDGTRYEIDLSNAHAKQLRELFEPYTRAGRKMPKHRAGRGQAGKTTTASNGRPNSHEVRDWARRNGIEISSRGRVPAHVYAKFEQAQHALT
jgi:hypothetical protein